MRHSIPRKSAHDVATLADHKRKLASRFMMKNGALQFA